MYAVMERADEAVEIGTPINRALFDSIKSGNDLVQKYSIPTFEKMFDDYNYLKLDNKINEYEKGMRLLIELNNNEIIYAFSESIIPALQADNKETNGYTSNHYLACDKNDSTLFSGQVNSTNSVTINFPTGIKPSKVKLKYTQKKNQYNTTIAYIIGTRYDGSTVELFNDPATFEGTRNETVSITSTEFYKSLTLRLKSNSGNDYSFSLYTFDIVEGECQRFNRSLPTYININELGNILINGSMELGKKYELIYDGHTFVATEVG